MSLVGKVVTIADTETSISENTSSGHQRVHVHVLTGGQSVFVGATGVLASTGFEIASPGDLVLTLEPGSELFGIVAATTQVVSVLEE